MYLLASLTALAFSASDRPATPGGATCAFDEIAGQCQGECACGNCYTSKIGTCGCDGATLCEDAETGDCDNPCYQSCGMGDTCETAPEGSNSMCVCKVGDS